MDVLDRGKNLFLSKSRPVDSGAWVVGGRELAQPSAKTAVLWDSISISDVRRVADRGRVDTRV